MWVFNCSANLPQSATLGLWDELDFVKSSCSVFQESVDTNLAQLILTCGEGVKHSHLDTWRNSNTSWNILTVCVRKSWGYECVSMCMWIHRCQSVCANESYRKSVKLGKAVAQNIQPREASLGFNHLSGEIYRIISQTRRREDLFI